MKNLHFLLLVFILAIAFAGISKAQEIGDEQIEYYQMEPLNDSLFIQIQEELFIDPPDPKAEIIADLRDPNNQTISIKGTLYPFLALEPGTRAKIITYPFKINLGDRVGYASVFTDVISKMRFSVSPPSQLQISSMLYYVNPFIQLTGGERFGVSIYKDVGLSFGLGTPYSGPLETNIVNASFHILGFYGGIYSNIDAFVQIKEENNHNNIFANNGFQVGYVIPLGNFLEVGYTRAIENPNESSYIKYFRKNPKDTASFSKYNPLFVDGSYVNFEVRYPIGVLGSTRGKVYVGRYLDEMHAGYMGRELSLAGSTFDLRFDAMFNSPVRQPQYLFEVLVQKIADYWGFSAFALGPSITMGTTDDGSFGMLSIFLNARLKVGTSF